MMIGAPAKRSELHDEPSRKSSKDLSFLNSALKLLNGFFHDCESGIFQRAWT